MILYFNCPNCKTENRFKSKSETRVELAMKHGKKMDLKCAECEKTAIISINKIYAKPSKKLIFIAGAVFLIGSLIVLYYVRQMIMYYDTTMGIYRVALGLVFPAAIYLTLNREDRNRVSTFNRSYINDRTD